MVSLFDGESKRGMWTEANTAFAESFCEIHHYLIKEEQFDANDFLRLHADAEGIITTWGSPELQDCILDRMPNLKFLAHAAGSVKPFFSKRAFEKNVRMFSGAYVIGIFVAEMTLSFALMGLRKTVQHNSFMHHDAGWRRDGLLHHMLFNAKVGLVGFGSVARQVAELFRSFTSEIYVYDPYLDDGTAVELKVKKESLEEIFKNSKVVSIHLPSIPSTENMIDSSLFGLMRHNCVFINTARASVVNTADMLDAIEKNKQVFCLDVFDVEPLKTENELRKHFNVVMAPHIAGPTLDGKWLILAFILKNIKNAIEGEKTTNEIFEPNYDLLA